MSELRHELLGVTSMDNMCVKARAGRRIALMFKAMRIARSEEVPVQHAASYAVQDLPRHQYLQRLSISEDRYSRLSAD